MSLVSVPCAQCSAEVRFGDDFCPACGATVARSRKRALRERLEASDSAARERGQSVRKASSALLWVAGAFVLGGIVMFFHQQGVADEALTHLRQFPPNAEVTALGKTYVVEDLRAIVVREPYQVLGINVGLAVLMVALFSWSKRSPVAALVTALAVFVTVHAVSAVLDPKTLFMGIIVKIFGTVALVRGVHAAVESGRVERGDA